MKRRDFETTGKITKDGKLAMYMEDVNQFFKAHKNSRVVVKFMVYEPGTSEALKGYYFNYVVPTFKAAIWEAGERLTEKQTEERLRQMSPIMYVESIDDAGKEYIQRFKKIDELSNAELVEHIETLKQIAAEEFNTYIEDPKTI